MSKPKTKPPRKILRPGHYDWVQCPHCGAKHGYKPEACSRCGKPMDGRQLEAEPLESAAGSAEAGESGSYFGGKGGAGVWQTIINHIPPHDTLLIPFAGHCAVSRSIRPCHQLILCDLSVTVGNWWYSCGRLPKHATYWRYDGVLAMRQIAAGSVAAVLGDSAGRVAVYCDPPYHPATRTSDHRYQHDWTAEQHDEFCDRVSPIPATTAAVLVSGYRCKAYDAAFSAARGWHRTDFQAMTRGGVRTESLWCNFDPHQTELHDYRFLGRNKREREKLSRRDRNLIRRLKQLPARERDRILAAVDAEFRPSGRDAERGDPVPELPRGADAKTSDGGHKRKQVKR